MIKIERLKRNIVIFFKIVLVVAIGLMIHVIIYYPERKKLANYREILSENHKSAVKAYVYQKNPKRRKIYYRFKITGTEYKGFSRYIQMCPHPEKGDSIWVYYKDDAPSVNLWVGEFEY